MTRQHADTDASNARQLWETRPAPSARASLTLAAVAPALVFAVSHPLPAALLVALTTSLVAAAR